MLSILQVNTKRKNSKFSTVILTFIGVYLRKLYIGLVEDMKSGDFKGLPEVHATSSGNSTFFQIFN